MYQANITHSCRFGVPHRTTYRRTRLPDDSDIPIERRRETGTPNATTLISTRSGVKILRVKKAQQPPRTANARRSTGAIAVARGVIGDRAPQRLVKNPAHALLARFHIRHRIPESDLRARHHRQSTSHAT